MCLKCVCLPPCPASPGCLKPYQNTLGTPTNIQTLGNTLGNTLGASQNPIRNNPKIFSKIDPKTFQKPLKSLQKHPSKPPKTLQNRRTYPTKTLTCVLFFLLSLPEILWLSLKYFWVSFVSFHTFFQSFSIYLSTFWPIFFHWDVGKPSFFFSLLTLPEILWLSLKNLHLLFSKTARVTKIHLFTLGLPLSLFISIRSHFGPCCSSHHGCGRRHFGRAAKALAC